MVLLAPPAAGVPARFKHVDLNPEGRTELLAQMQRLRGSVYLDDGAVERPQLSVDGLHQAPEDERSWHLLMVDHVVESLNDRLADVHVIARHEGSVASLVCEFPSPGVAPRAGAAAA